MLAKVSDRDEADAAIAGGVDVVEFVRSGTAAEPPALLDAASELVAMAAGRCLTSVFAGELGPGAPGSTLVGLLDCGLDFVRVAVKQQAILGTAKQLGGDGITRLIGVVFADQISDTADAAALAAAEFAGIMVDGADPTAGRLLQRWDIPALGAFVRSARSHGLLVGFAGGLEAPDVPRLLQLGPDLLGFGRSLRNQQGIIDKARIGGIRGLIPRESGTAVVQQAASEGTRRTVAQRIFVRDLVLPVRIGAYADERTAPQKVRFNVSVELEPGAGAPTDMGQVLSYDLITDGIASIVAQGHIDFAETLAERIAAHVLGQPRARQVTVKVEKLERGPAVVGVEIVAVRDGGVER